MRVLFLGQDSDLLITFRLNIFIQHLSKTCQGTRIAGQVVDMKLESLSNGNGNDNGKKSNKLRLRSDGTSRIFNWSKIPTLRCSVHTEPRKPYEYLNATPFKNLNAKIEIKFLTCTVENLKGEVLTPCPADFLNGKDAVAWMRGNSAGRSHFAHGQMVIPNKS